jgi:hypothetical protein
MVLAVMYATWVGSRPHFEILDKAEKLSRTKTLAYSDQVVHGHLYPMVCVFPRHHRFGRMSMF